MNIQSTDLTLSDSARGNLSVSAKIEKVLISGDLSALTEAERVEYYNATCESLGLNKFTRPFDYIKLNGKLTLYARRDCTDQLRNLNKISIRITSREKIEDVFIVTAEANDKTGRIDTAIGAVPIKGLSGDALANAFMKAETKAKRRVTLSICGLGFTDESEVESIPNATINIIENHKPTSRREFPSETRPETKAIEADSRPNFDDEDPLFGEVAEKVQTPDGANPWFMVMQGRGPEFNGRGKPLYKLGLLWCKKAIQEPYRYTLHDEELEAIEWCIANPKAKDIALNQIGGTL